MRNRLFSIAALLSLSGCAGFIKTNAVNELQAKAVPNDRVMAFQAQAPGTAKITVIRDAGVLGSACYLAVEIEGKLAARFDTGEAASFFVAPGAVELSVAPDPMGRGLCAAVSFGRVGEKYMITTERVTTYRLSSRQFRRPELEEVDGNSSTVSTAAPVATSLPVPTPQTVTTTPAPPAPPAPPAAAAVAVAVSEATPTVLPPAPTPAPPPALPSAPAPVSSTSAAREQVARSLPGGQDGFSAARVARDTACHPQPTTVMTAKGPGFESYTVACLNGDSLAIRCEFGNCRVLR